MIEVTRRIDAPAQVVWAVLERIEDHAAWMKDAIAIRFEGEQRRGVGTRIVVDMRVGPLRTVDRMEFVSWEPGVAMGVEHRGLIGGSGEFTLTTDGSATTVTWREDLQFPWYLAGRFGAAVGGPILRRIWRGNLERLADRCS
jgi:carbon monoxide dehydrogenase subunit G